MNEKKTVDISQYRKTEAAFEQWFNMKFDKPEMDDLENFFGTNAVNREDFYKGRLISFYDLPFAFQQGVFLAFLQENKIAAWEEYQQRHHPGFTVGHYAHVANYYTHHKGSDRSTEVLGNFDTRSTALIAAIEAGFARLEAEITAGKRA